MTAVNVADHLPLVRAIAAQMARTALRGAEVEDLVAWGTIGLAESVARFDAAKGAFSTLATIRIRGAMLDGARAELGGGRRNHELLARTDIDPAEMRDPSPSADELVDRAAVASAVRAAVAALPPRERTLVEAVDCGGEQMKDACARVGVSRSRACRIRAGALATLRAQLTAVWF
jgi:RNA polymerase sigma factor (sigma-70 family)